jgi:hypothetical protein
MISSMGEFWNTSTHKAHTANANLAKAKSAMRPDEISDLASRSPTTNTLKIITH